MSLCSSPTSLWIGLGTPSILKAKLDADASQRMMLFDANSTLAQRFPRCLAKGDLIICDLLVDSLPALTADVIVVDPPWYYEEMASFLWAARQMCRVGGRVFLSAPKVGTRPGIGSELEQLARWIRQLGFTVEAFKRDLIEYRSPFFERNALRAEGVVNYPDNWRRADLVVLQAEENTVLSRPSAPTMKHTWQGAVVGTMRLRVSEDKQNEFRDPSLRSLTADDQPVSVSRRDRRKHEAKIWTSGNRVFDCNGVELFLSIVRAIEEQRSPVSAVEAVLGRSITLQEAARVRVTVKQVEKLAAIEHAELRATTQDSVSKRIGPSTSSATMETQSTLLLERFGTPATAGVHIAVFVEPFLRLVIEGRKTIESRFSLTRRAPFKQVAVGDLVLLKKSGGPIVGSCRVAQTWFYAIDPASWKHIRTEFSQAICAEDPEFWSKRAEAKYATLLRIEDVRTFAPRTFPKKDRRGWVVLRRATEKLKSPSNAKVSLILGISGLPGSGKSTLAAAVATKLGARVLSFGDFFRFISAGADVQSCGRNYVANYKPETVVDEFFRFYAPTRPDVCCVIEGIRHVAIWQALRERAYCARLIFLDVHEKALLGRLVARSMSSVQEARARLDHPVEAAVWELRETADIVLQQPSPHEALARVLDALAEIT
jgi:cytidylate kinase